MVPDPEQAEASLRAFTKEQASGTLPQDMHSPDRKLYEDNCLLHHGSVL